MPIPKLIAYFLVDVFHPQNMFWLDVVGICFKGVRYSLLFVGSYCFVFLGVWERALFQSNLSLIPVLFGFVVFSSYLCFSACLVFCLMGSASFIWNDLRHLGIVFP